MGNVWGAIAGGVAITWFDYTGLEWMSSTYNSGVGKHINLVLHLKQYEFGLFGLVLVLMMLFRPQGLIPATRSRQVRRADAQVLQHDKLGYALETGIEQPEERARHHADPFEEEGSR